MSIEVQPPKWAKLLITEHDSSKCSCHEYHTCLGSQLLEGAITVEQLSEQRLA